ncbi:unnamed protein product [Linum trigynum]|uniref:Uncharacterized protein n=1 Tax=Linum trigynum TaxID=586398 RepID=A0AAV2F7J5_9ROSI
MSSTFFFHFRLTCKFLIRFPMASIRRGRFAQVKKRGKKASEHDEEEGGGGTGTRGWCGWLRPSLVYDEFDENGRGTDKGSGGRRKKN